MGSSVIQRKYHSKGVTAEPIASRPWFSWLCWIFRKWEFNEFQMGRWLVLQCFKSSLRSLYNHTVRVLWRNRTKRMCVCIEGDLLSGTGPWDYRPVPGSVISKLETQENLWGSSGLKVGTLETWRGRIFQFESSGRERLMFWTEAVKWEKLPLLEGGSAFLLYAGLNWLDETHSQ